MDPLTGIGAAASAVQLLEALGKVFKTAQGLRHSADGVLQENREMETCAEDLLGLLRRLGLLADEEVAGDGDGRDEANELREEDGRWARILAAMNRDAARELLGLLGELRVDDPSSRSEVVRKSFKSVLKERKKGQSLERVRMLREQLALHLQGDVLAVVEGVDRKVGGIDAKVESLERKLDGIIGGGGSVCARDVGVREVVTESPLGKVTSTHVTETKQEVVVTEMEVCDSTPGVFGQPAPACGLPSAASAIVVSPRRLRCGDPTCACFCHLSQYVRTPQFLKRLTGAVVFRGSCKNHQSKLWELRYWTPHFLSNYNWYLLFERTASGTPSFGLKLQRKVPWGGEDTIVRFAVVGDVEGIKTILNSGRAALDDVDPNHGRTPLHYAIMKGHVAACKLLLDAGASPYLEDASNTSAEEKAWEHILTNRGTPFQLSQLRSLFPNHDLEQYRFSPLHLAVLGEGPSLASLLSTFSTSLDLNPVDARQRTPLHWAAQRSDLSSVATLLTAGAAPSRTDASRSTALHYAVSSGFPQMVKLLLQHGADPNAKTSRGDTPLHFAARHRDDLPTVKVLVAAGADVHARNSLGNTPLSGAAIMNRCAAGEYLIDHCGADVNTANMYGDTPLIETVQHNCVGFLELLLARGARYDGVNYRGETVLHTLALEGREETARVFIRLGMMRGVDVEKRNGEGRTAREVLGHRTGVRVGFREAFEELVTIMVGTVDGETEDSSTEQP